MARVVPLAPSLTVGWGPSLAGGPAGANTTSAPPAWAPARRRGSRATTAPVPV